MLSVVFLIHTQINSDQTNRFELKVRSQSEQGNVSVMFPREGRPVHHFRAGRAWTPSGSPQEIYWHKIRVYEKENG